MSNDIWRELAQVHRETQREERDRLGERWDRLSHGELSAEEEAELRALAETSEEAREAYEAFRPLGPEFHASVVQAIRAQGLAPEAEHPVPKPRAKLLPFPRRATRLAGWGTAAAAIAAVVLVLFLRLMAEPLPVYKPDLIGGARDFRGGREASTPVRVFGPGDLLTLDAQPQQPVTDLLEAQAFVARGTELVPLELEPIVENGVVRLRGTVGREIRLPPGEQRIWIVVGRKGEIPPLDELAGLVGSRQTRHDDWQAVSADLRIENRPSG